ncbi:MAG TPA: hypothetical protein VMW17_19575 [Candidatus Binatia bacterium]|nr:hypothetical protein [Candidatus Binatia bacterium]
MHVVFTLFVPVMLLVTAGIKAVDSVVQLADAPQHPPAVVDVNRPRVPEDCDLPIGINWYGTRERCLAELCAGRNVYNEYIFDAANRRRKNPCYGQSPTDFPEP